MKKLLAAACLIFAFAPAAFSIEPTQWQYRQPIDITQPGPLRISLPLETLGRAQPDLRDLRILAPDGTELPYAILDVPTERAASESIEIWGRPVSLRVDTAEKKLFVTIETGTDKRLDSVELLVPDTKDYLLPARIEISGDGEKWEMLSSEQVLFRRGREHHYGAVAQSTFSLSRRTAAWVRVTISFDTEPVAVSGAMIRTVTGTPGRAAMPDENAPVKISHVEHDSNTTTLTLDLGAANVSLSQLHFDIADTLFMRNVSVTSTPLDDKTTQKVPADKATLQVLATGYEPPIYSIKGVDDTLITANTTLKFDGTPVKTRTIWVNIDNADSPPLHILGVTAKRRPVLIAFNPPAAGRYTLLSGNAQAPAPRYDLAAFSQNLGRLPVTQIVASPIEPTPDYRAPKPPPSGEPLNLATRALFWVALALVVILLLVVVAKLLPKPKE